MKVETHKKTSSIPIKAVISDHGFWLRNNGTSLTWVDENGVGAPSAFTSFSEVLARVPGSKAIFEGESFIVTM